MYLKNHYLNCLVPILALCSTNALGATIFEHMFQGTITSHLILHIQQNWLSLMWQVPISVFGLYWTWKTYAHFSDGAELSPLSHMLKPLAIVSVIIMLIVLFIRFIY